MFVVGVRRSAVSLLVTRWSEGVVKGKKVLEFRKFSLTETPILVLPIKGSRGY